MLLKHFMLKYAKNDLNKARPILALQTPSWILLQFIVASQL